jgi:hypothetical protein
MESERPHLSITLPRNFMFHYRDGQAPQTPEPEPQPEQLQPPAPPRQTLKVRRRRTTFVMNQDFDDFPDVVPIPTIEAPELHSDSSMGLPTLPQILDTGYDTGYLSPGVSFGRMISPPKTPVSQMRGHGGFDGPQHWSDVDQASQSEFSSRPTSSSGFSDSSVSSRGSFDSFASLGGSCTSPEEDMMDPFSFDSPELKYRHLSSPLAAHQPRQPAKLKLRATFTEEMDHHLWMTYMKYLQDPTVTPFKALPSTVPPNGVCHRVARMARKTWRMRTSINNSGVRIGSQFAPRCGTPDTIKPVKSGSSTPVPGCSRPCPRYPTEKQCRRRLRDLAKQKPTLSAHYQRLLNRRSPSPLQSSPQQPSTQPAGLSSPFPLDAPSFSTRDLNVSLATSTAASMQFGNPLAELASEPEPRAQAPSWSKMRSSAHQKSQSLHIGLGLGISGMARSPFQTMSHLTDMSLNQHNSQTWHAPSVKPTKLGSPLQLHAPRPMARPFKRRALHNFESQAARNRGSSFVDQVFGAPAESSHRRVRSRGFSLGDMMDGARRLPLSTSGPLEFNPFADVNTQMQNVSPPTSVSQEPQGHATVRLGSPFDARPNNTFPRTSSSYEFEPPVSFEQRFAGFNPNLQSDPAQLPRL